MASDDTHVSNPVLPDQGSEITTDTSIRSKGADPTPPDNSGGGDASGAPSTWLPTEEPRLKNLKRNCRRAFSFYYYRPGQLHPQSEDDPWFARVVENLRDGPYQDNSELEIMEAPVFMKGARPLHLAVLMGDLEMVQKISESRLGPNDVQIDSLVGENEEKMYSALDLAIVCAESTMVGALLQANAKVNTHCTLGSLQLAVVHAREEQGQSWRSASKIIDSLLYNGIDVSAKDRLGYTPFYIAVAIGKTEVVEKLLGWRSKLDLNEVCGDGRPPIRIAQEEGFKDIEYDLGKCDEVIPYLNTPFQDRQAYVDAANAILVGAALIASVTFASWLQPPLNYTTLYHGSSVEYVDVEHNIGLGSFWMFNTLSFYFAIGTVVFGAVSVLPRGDLFITDTVKRLRKNLIITSILLGFSVLFVIVAFGIAGFIVLIPIFRYQWYMIAPMILGGIVSLGSIVYLFKNVWESRPWKNRSRKRAIEGSFICDKYGFYD